jgi:hypothetical protein
MPRRIAVAHTVVSALEQVGLTCWIAPRDVVPGALYASEIVRAINECHIVVLVVSAQSAASVHVGKELERASSTIGAQDAFTSIRCYIWAENYFLSAAPG